MSVIHKELNTAAQVARLSDVLSFIEQNLEEAGFTFKDVMQINLAVEEIFVNVASYAYPDGDGSAEIIIDIEETPLSATIKVIDSGIPFNPLEHEDPDVTLKAEDRGIGGLGIYLTKKTMDSVSYSYENGKNILTMTKTV